MHMQEAKGAAPERAGAAALRLVEPGVSHRSSFRPLTETGWLERRADSLRHVPASAALSCRWKEASLAGGSRAMQACLVP